jgi:hypothetical protein
MPFESDPIAAKLNDLVTSLQPYRWLVPFDQLSPAKRVLFAIWELEQEVYNGGFKQYFQNSSGDRVPVICEILRIVGADRVALVLERAIALAGPNIPWGDIAKRYPLLNHLPEDIKDKLFDLNKELYKELDDLNASLFRYLSKHRDELDAPADFWVEETTKR